MLIYHVLERKPPTSDFIQVEKVFKRICKLNSYFFDNLVYYLRVLKICIINFDILPHNDMEFPHIEYTIWHFVFIICSNFNLVFNLLFFLIAIFLMIFVNRVDESITYIFISYFFPTV